MNTILPEWTTLPNGNVVEMDTQHILVVTVNEAKPVTSKLTSIKKWWQPLNVSNLKVLEPTSPKAKGKYITIYQPTPINKKAPFLLANKDNNSPANATPKRHKCTVCSKTAKYACCKNANHYLCKECANNGMRETCPLCTFIVGAKQLEE